jgi:hypothetical protein
VFLCGGRISTSAEKFGSCRHIFHNYLQKTNRLFGEKVLLAEKIFDYFEHADYQDLLEFEIDLAELCALIVIFSEGYGAIAELGSFSVLETVQQKLLVVMRRDHTYKEGSFIWRGPALHLKKLAQDTLGDDPIAIYDWPSRDGESFREQDFSHSEDLADLIETILSKLPRTQSFNKDRAGHVMLLMLDLLKVLQLATLEEIIVCLKHLSIESERRVVEQHLSLLKSLNYLISYPYRNNVYYVSHPEEPWLTWRFRETAWTRDLDRWRARFLEYYEGKQEHKFRALKSLMKRTRQIGD